MPALPPGEAQLQKLGERFTGADAAIGGWLAEAAIGDPRRDITQTLEEVPRPRRPGHRGPVVAAYLAEHPEGRASAVKDLADGLALKLDQGAVSAADAVRQTFPKVTPDNIAEMAEKTAIAHVDRRGAEWSLGWWAMTNTATT